ncbi:TonB-dependent hemoglobin/transferrin/lactoferrin family receptor [Sphingobacterium humi]|uniref:TonB-dependent hemoglobin/transferrin/lactoferrin family receptor n=1 Tax=Sphingobacterium humi TaxID=1796905 RepID=A0A6N8L0S8_9SPHI|nr:TonB-dependent hemoglobin/transferrin/lactoferrin family receptor [Sphingobacterium humi]MVZ62956.1 TonB-dependent hemoglobin/transferrin/lactoferrin family receptor [Sphingobacterium humi]
MTNRLLFFLLFALPTCFSQQLFGQQKDTLTQKIDTSKTQQLREVEIIRQRNRTVGSSLIGQKQLAKEMTSDMRDLIRYTPGVGISYSGGRAGNRGFAIRGVEANRVAISVDGIQQPEIHENLVFSAYGLSNASRIEFDPYFVSSIVIQKGASSFSAGSGALGGAVNYQSKQASDLIAEGRNYGAQAQVNYNGKDNLRMYLAGIALKKGNWEGLFMFADRKANELKNFSYGSLNRNVTSTQIDPMTHKQQSLLGKLAFQAHKDHRIDLSYYLLNKRVNAEIWSQEPMDIFTAANRPYYYANDQSLSHSYSLSYQFQSATHWIQEASLRANLQDSYLDASTWSAYFQPNFDGKGDYELFYEGRRDKFRGQEIKDKSLQGSINFSPINAAFWGMHHLSLTAYAQEKGNDSRNVDMENPVAANIKDGYTVRFGKRYALGESIGKITHAYAFQRPIYRRNYGASLLDMIQLDAHLSLQLGLRYDRFQTQDRQTQAYTDGYYLDYLMRGMQNISLSNTAIRDNDQGLSYLVSAAYRFRDDLNLSYKFSTGYRVPTTEERYFQYFNYWPSFLVLSNRELKPETSHNHEVELAGSGNFGTYVVNFYRSDYKNFIEVERGTMAVQSSIDHSNKNIAYVKHVNRSAAKLMGMDVKMHLQLDVFHHYAEGFELNMAASYAKGETDYGTSLLAAQPLTGFAGIEYLSLDQKWQANFVGNYFKAKNKAQTRFVENTAQQEVQRQFPGLFFEDAYSFDLFGSYQLNRHALIRAGVYNLFNQKYWRWDDLRQLTNPALLPHIDSFFREGNKTISRFSQPNRYFSINLTYNL